MEYKGLIVDTLVYMENTLTNTHLTDTTKTAKTMKYIFDIRLCLKKLKEIKQ